METINIKIVIADNSKKLDSKRGNIYGLFEKKKDGSYLLNDDKVFIYLVQSQDMQEAPLYDAIMGIPKVSILRINKLK